MQEINLNTRGFDKPTDVLSFPYDDMPLAPLGSIVISENFVDEKSKLYNHSFEDEFMLLFIHGILHLLGYDHEVDNGEHRAKEEELINKQLETNRIEELDCFMSYVNNPIIISKYCEK